MRISSRLDLAATTADQCILAAGRAPVPRARTPSTACADRQWVRHYSRSLKPHRHEDGCRVEGFEPFRIDLAEWRSRPRFAQLPQDEPGIQQLACALVRRGADSCHGDELANTHRNSSM
jgi:hypothetical protein